MALGNLLYCDMHSDNGKSPSGPVPSAAPEGAVHAYVEVNASDLRDWSPERIGRFFDGIARAVAARNTALAERCRE